MNWKIEDFVAEHGKLEVWVAENLVKLFSGDNTIPFISRYRKEMTGNMEPQKIREVHRSWEQAKQIKKRSEFVNKEITKTGKMTEKLSRLLCSARSLDEIENLYTPFKSGSKRTLAERAKALGLEKPAMEILAGSNVNFQTYVKPGEKGLTNVKDIEDGIKHILSDYISKQTETQTFLRNLIKKSRILLESKFSKSKDIKEELKKNFENYSDFSANTNSIKPHQVLAINRGENQKVLSVKLVVPEWTKIQFQRFVDTQFLRNFPKQRHTFGQNVLNDCYDRLIQPQICRNVRSELSKSAELASVDTFASNLKQLLLCPPVKDSTIMGIDPGFKHGCKLAVISVSGDVLDTGVVYLPTNIKETGKIGLKMDKNVEKIRDMILRHSVPKIAIGNGTACRETEAWISVLIRENVFQPLRVEYCIINECGASIYSVTDLAVKELPNVDPNIRSAISISRRLLDPLAELVKVQPKHLGVGMYQHDLNEKLLQESLDSVVEECCSFVGVDLNTCSLELLQRVAGMNKSRASKILELRKSVGFITNRLQLKNIKGIGEKSFQQCAGFVRIYSRHSSSDDKKGIKGCNAQVDDKKVGKTRKRKPQMEDAPDKTKKMKYECESNPLDATSVHPESYDLAEELVKLGGCSSCDIGERCLISGLDSLSHDILNRIAEKYSVGPGTVQDILKAMKQPRKYDFREKFDRPMFRQSVRGFDDLKEGTRVRGTVTNVTHFGAFVDIGVGRNGLIHISSLRASGLNVEVGTMVEVVVLNVDPVRKKIGLKPV